MAGCARSERSRCEQVFDLGADGSGHPHEVAEVANFQKAAAAAGNGRDIFSGRTPADRKGTAVAHIAVVPPTQSVRCDALHARLAMAMRHSVPEASGSANAVNPPTY